MTPRAKLLNRMCMAAFWLMALCAFAFLFYPDLRLLVPMMVFCLLAWLGVGLAMMNAALAARASQDAKERKEFGGYLAAAVVFLLVGIPGGIYAILHFARNQMP
jgi:uncharacterized protein YhhL (DUF1145 family)